VFVGSLATSAANSVAVNGNRVYVIDSGQLKVIDVTNPAAPGLISTSSSYAGQQIAASGHFVFLAEPVVSHPGGGIRVIDVSVPTSPVFLELIGVPGLTRTVTAQGTNVYAGDNASVVDVFDP
jgi:hypothetical protein